MAASSHLITKYLLFLELNLQILEITTALQEILQEPKTLFFSALRKVTTYIARDGSFK